MRAILTSIANRFRTFLTRFQLGVPPVDTPFWERLAPA
jgi:hypothetical protein